MKIEVSKVIEPMGFGLDVAAKVIGVSRAKAYNLVNAGLLRAKKVDGRTITTPEYCREFLESMPDYEPKSAA